MDMTCLTTEAQQLIARKELGTPLQIYSPPTKSVVALGLVALGLVLGVIVFIAWVASTSGVPDAFSTAMPAFVLFGLMAIVDLFVIGWAIFSRKKHVVVCTLGVALLSSEDTESFRWKDVLTTTTNLIGSRGGRYTVHCHDGRKIVFKGLSHLQDLAETIDVQLARAQHPR